MITAHNLLAMNANRMYGINAWNLRTTTEKLASGYAINRAADDAAGLSISEKMRRQIRGLNQGAENIMDGISMLQVADGALTEVHDMLQRMNQLSVQAANGTNAEGDRKAIQREIDALVTEIDRIGETTAFNEIKVFQGRYAEDSGNTAGVSGRDIFVKGKPTDVGITDYRISADVTNGVTINGTNYAWSDIKDGKGNSLAAGIQAGIFSFSFNGMQVEIGVSATDTLENIAEDLDGLTFQTNPPNSGVSSITMGKTAAISLLYVYDEATYVDLNHSGTCEISATQSGITITNRKTKASAYLDFTEVGAGYTKSYEDLMNEGTLNRLMFEFPDTQYTLNLDLNAGWTKDDVIKALNHATYDTGFSGAVGDHYTTMPSGASIQMDGFHCSFSKAFYVANGCDVEKLNIENPFVGHFVQDALNPYQYTIQLEKDGMVNTFILNQAGQNRLSAIGSNGCNAGDSVVLAFQDAAGNSIEATFKAKRKINYADLTDYLGRNEFSNLGNSIYAAGNFVEASKQAYHIDLSRTETQGKRTVMEDGRQIRIQCSAQTKDQLILHIGRMDAEVIGIRGLQVSSEEDATAAIDIVSKAIEKIAEQRSLIGAQQNRLEHAYAINRNTAENTQYAETQIRDADMAELILRHARDSILADASQMMLAQANQTGENVLRILS